MRIVYSIIIIISFFYSCKDYTKIEKKIEDKSELIANSVDSSTIRLFMQYNYYTRGGNLGFWTNNSIDSLKYSCEYNLKNDSSELKIFIPLNFTRDFNSNFNFDTSNFESFKLIQFKENIVKVIQIRRNAEEIQIDTNVSTKLFFRNKNPFQIFGHLDSIKREFDIISIYNRGNLKGLVQLWLSPYYWLTYVGDSSNLSAEKRKYWQYGIGEIKKINQNWVLQKIYE